MARGELVPMITMLSRSADPAGTSSRRPTDVVPRPGTVADVIFEPDSEEDTHPSAPQLGLEIFHSLSSVAPAERPERHGVFDRPSRRPIRTVRRTTHPAFVWCAPRSFPWPAPARRSH